MLCRRRSGTGPVPKGTSRPQVLKRRLSPSELMFCARLGSAPPRVSKPPPDPTAQGPQGLRTRPFVTSTQVLCDTISPPGARSARPSYVHDAARIALTVVNG